MPGRYKPGLDWTALRACWEAGQSGSSLAKRFNVTRQGIEYRARSEHWQRAARAEGISATATMARIEAPKTHHDRALLALDAKRTPSAMRTILEALANGSTKAMSARLAGISRDSLDGWLEADEGFARLADVASAEFAAGAVKRVKQAGERGEWRADLALLERHPQTRSEWAPNVETPSAAGEGIKMTIIFQHHIENNPLAKGMESIIDEQGRRVFTNYVSGAAPLRGTERAEVVITEQGETDDRR